MIRIATVTVVAFFLAFGLQAAARHDGPHAGPDDEVFNVGKNGGVKIGMDVAIGSVLLKKGKYAVAHRVEGDAHILVLTGLDNKTETQVHEIPLRLIPSRDPVKKSALFAVRQRDRSYRVSVVQIAGESGDHIPGPVTGS